MMNNVRKVVDKEFSKLDNKIIELSVLLSKPLKQSQIFPYIITNKFKLKMMEKTKESIDKNIEIGFSICKNIKNNVLIDKDDCVGEKCSVIMKIIKCEDDEVIVGSFHTHTTSLPIAAISDLTLIYTLGLGFIGGLYSRNINIKCYERKEEFNISILDELYKEAKKEQKFMKGNLLLILYPHSKKIYEFTNKYFNVINII